MEDFVRLDVAYPHMVQSKNRKGIYSQVYSCLDKETQMQVQDEVNGVRSYPYYIDPLVQGMIA
jgi:hypothetical protein